MNRVDASRGVDFQQVDLPSKNDKCERLKSALSETLKKRGEVANWDLLRDGKFDPNKQIVALNGCDNRLLCLAWKLLKNDCL